MHWQWEGILQSGMPVEGLVSHVVLKEMQYMKEQENKMKAKQDATKSKSHTEQK